MPTVRWAIINPKKCHLLWAVVSSGYLGNICGEDTRWTSPVTHTVQPSKPTLFAPVLISNQETKSSNVSPPCFLFLCLHPIPEASMDTPYAQRCSVTFLQLSLSLDAAIPGIFTLTREINCVPYTQVISLSCLI